MIYYLLLPHWPIFRIGWVCRAGYCVSFVTIVASGVSIN